MSGRTRALQLIDKIISRKYFLEVSWTGASHSNDRPKYPLKFATNFINTFKDICAECDASFNDFENARFFKNCCANAKTRFENEVKGIKNMPAAKKSARKSKKTKAANKDDDLEKNDDKDENQTDDKGNDEIADGENIQSTSAANETELNQNIK